MEVKTLSLNAVESLGVLTGQGMELVGRTSYQGR